MAKRYDVAVIGSGPGGYTAAIKLSQAGKHVCIIDVDEAKIGGVCLNEGCIPLKSLLHSARTYSLMKKAADSGIEAQLKIPDMAKIVESSQRAVSQLRSGLKNLFKKNHTDFILGKAALSSARTLSVCNEGRKEEIEAENIIVASGSHPKVPSGLRIDKEAIITSKEAIRLGSFPGKLLVIGAGAIGVEFSVFFASFGTEVTLIEMMPNVLPSADEEISKALARSLRKNGINVITDANVKSIDRKDGSVEAVWVGGGKETQGVFESVLVAVGREPNTGGIGLREAGIELKSGFVMTDSKMKTSQDNIYAVGDVVNSPMYAHVAYKEADIAVQNISASVSEELNYECVPHVVFSEPQIASVGLTEEEARNRGCEIAVSKQFFKANGMAVATHSDEGFIKIIADKRDGKIIGVHIIGGAAAEIIQEFVLAKHAGLTAEYIGKVIHAHPTFSEIAVEATRAVFGKSIYG